MAASCWLQLIQIAAGLQGEQGLLAIPCIVGHISQLFIDAAIVSRMASDLVRLKSPVAEPSQVVLDFINS